MYADYVDIPEVEYGTRSFEPVTGEAVGQLYSYRLNDSAVYLGTRRRIEFGASIGIGNIADGLYTCFAKNENENNTLEISITVLCKLHLLINCTKFKYFLFKNLFSTPSCRAKYRLYQIFI